MARKSKYKWWEKYIFARARAVWRWSPARRAAIQAATRGGKVFCVLCEEYIVPVVRFKTVKGRKRRLETIPLDVDHITPVVDVTEGFVGWDQYLSRLLDVPVEGLQVLCKPCHKAKTNLEAKKRGKK